MIAVGSVPKNGNVIRTWSAPGTPSTAVLIVVYSERSRSYSAPAARRWRSVGRAVYTRAV